MGIVQARILEQVSMPSSREIFPTQGLNLGLLHCRQILYHLSHQVTYKFGTVREYLYCLSQLCVDVCVLSCV